MNFPCCQFKFLTGFLYNVVAINAAAAIIILLAITFTMNGIAVYFRNKWQKKINW